MDNILTVRDLLLPGEPLDPAEVVAGQNRLQNPVSWVVSLRPYPPAFPRLRGGELALVATEHLLRLEPPTTLADVVRHLASRSAAGVAVRGEVDQAAAEAAQEGGMPLLLLQPDAPLPDIEQAIMRECALYQARREMQPVYEPGAWVMDLLAGRFTSVAEVQSAATKSGDQRPRLATHYAVAYLVLQEASAGDDGGEDAKRLVRELEANLKKVSRATGASLLVQPWEGGLAALLPQSYGERLIAVLAENGLPCGVGGEKPVLEAPTSLAEARLAATSSALLHGGKPVRYADMGAERLLLLLYRGHPHDLWAFVEDTLGPLLRHDAGSATPLLPTLQSFLAHGGRLRETASEIYVHRNTLAYRLDRAAEVLGADLKDQDTRLAIELALRALPLLEAMGEK